MKKVVSVGAMTAVLTISLVIAQIAYASAPEPVDYMTVVSGSGISQNQNLAIFTVTANGAIPTTPDSFINDNIAVGYAWADVHTGKALVAVTHPSFRDSTQNPTSWHTHTVSLTGGAKKPNDFCVASVDSSPTAGITISSNTMTVNISQDSLPGGETPSSLSAVVGFTLQSDSKCASGLAVLTYT